MSSKKEKKEREIETVKNSRIIQNSNDHELFLQAFEKPTQIYRYLKCRHTLTPLFLHRNLSYMKERMSRKHSINKEFRIDSLLNIVTNRNGIETDKTSCPNNYLTIMFLGINDKSISQEQSAKVSIIVSKIAQMKRKDCFTKNCDEMGTAKIKINPVDMIGKIPAISIASEIFKPAGTGSINRSCYLQLQIEYIDLFQSYETELVVFDKHNRCALSEGEYEMPLTIINSDAQRIVSPKKPPIWDIIPDSYFDEFSENHIHNTLKSPFIKFRLAWTKDKMPEHVDRPLPITIKKEDHFITNNKENEPNLKIGCIKIEPNDTNGNNDVKTIKNENDLNSVVVVVANNNTLNQNHNNNNNSLNNNNSCNNNKTSQTNSTANTSNSTKSLNNGNQTTTTTVAINPIVKLHDIASKIIYHFIYNNNSSQQTETFDNFNCPWCCVHCLTLYSLLKHLKLCHARFNFTYVPSQNGVRVDVSINELFDGSYTGSPNDLVSPAASAFARNGPVRRTIVTRILVCRPHRLKQSLNEFLEIDENELNAQRPYIQGHNRLYFHSLTCLPVMPRDLENDSEGENDPPWLQTKTKQMIDEFTDVNEGEKELMKMWNLHIMNEGYVGEIQISLACEMFIDKHGEDLLKKNLYKNFVLHLCNLWDYGLVTPDLLNKSILKMQRLLTQFIDGQDVLKQATDKQIDYWNKFGVHKQKQMQLEQQKQQQQQQQLQLEIQQNQQPSTSGLKRTVSTAKIQRNDINEESNKIKPNGGDDNYDDDDNNMDNEQDKQNTNSDQAIKGRIRDAKKNGVAKKIGTKNTLSKRRSTMTVCEAPRSFNSLKRKSSFTRGDSPPRRRSASAALQLTESISNGSSSRRNSVTNSNISLASAKKRKRLTLSLTKNLKNEK